MSTHLEGPPSYDEATSQDHWKFIAPYVASPDLCNTSLVCSRWHTIFSPQLWADPASHFGTEDDSVYVALTRFRRVLPWARLLLRRMTHTLRIPPAHAELYEGPHAEWLRIMLQRLPRLQCLVVEALPFFDHGCLMALRAPLIVHSGLTTHLLATNLRLLNASHCSKATYSGLAAALKQFPGLLWLDLSHTPAARRPSVLEVFDCMIELQVLKLVGIGLKDDDVRVLAKSIGLTVRCLDVSDNHLTDRSARDLVKHCFKKQQDQRSTHPPNAVPSLPGGYTSREYLGEDLMVQLRNRLMQDFVDTFVLQDEMDPGLSHLSIANNKLTIEGVASFALTGELRHLDAGSIARHFDQPSPASATSLPELPGAEKLVNVMKQVLPERLTYLRIGHEFVTRKAPIGTLGNGQPAELTGTVPIVKLKSSEDLDAHELTAVATEPSITKDGNKGMVSHDGIETLALPYQRERRYSGYIEERKARIAYQQSHACLYSPLLTPKLRILVLCNIPEKTDDRSIPSSIIQLISNCAKEQDLSYAEARANYACPPGANRKAFERQYARSIFALERIVLEMADPSLVRSNLKASASWRLQPTSEASTEDPDVEAFWGAAQQDFTFFNEEDRGKPLMQETSTPSWFMSAVSANPPNANHSQRPAVPKKAEVDTFQEPAIDVIAEISKFRQDRITAKQSRVAAGFFEDAVPGFWEGNIQVTRPYRGT